MMGWHLTLATDLREPMFREEAERRAALRALATVTWPVLALFALVDEHLHALLLEERSQVGRMAQALVLLLRSRVAGQLQPARFRPIEGRSHAESLVRYLLQQPSHHGLPVHPALWSGSCFLDLVGARRLDPARLRIQSLVPRFRLGEAFSLVGLPREELSPLPDEALRTVGVVRLASAAASVLAIGPTLTGRTALEVSARTAVCQLARRVRIPTVEVARALALSEPQTRNLAATAPDEALHRAIRLRLALEDLVLRHPGGLTAIDPSSGQGSWPAHGSGLPGRVSRRETNTGRLQLPG